MASSSSSSVLEDFETQLEMFVENVRQIKIIVSDFQPQGQAVLNQKIQNAITGLQEMNKLKSNIQDIHVPLEVFEYIDKGHNPQLYTKYCIEKALHKNEQVKGKVDAFKKFKANVLNDLVQTFPNELNKYRALRSSCFDTNYAVTSIPTVNLPLGTLQSGSNNIHQSQSAGSQLGKQQINNSSIVSGVSCLNNSQQQSNVPNILSLLGHDGVSTVSAGNNTELRNMLNQVRYISLTTDVWTEIMQICSYIGIIVHFIDGTNIESGAIEVTKFEGSHTSKYLSEVFVKTLSEWGIEKNHVVAVTTDSWANIKKAKIDEFVEKHTCFAHTINLTNLENIFVSFGLLSEEEAQQFLKGILPTKVHIAIWMKIIEVLIPITKIEQSLNVSNYDEMINYIYEKNLHFQSVVKKNYLPPELIPKLKVQTGFNESSESIEEVYNELTKIIKKPFRSDEKNDKSCDLEQLPNYENPKLMDLISIKREIDQYIQISSENETVSIDDIQLNRKSLQDCYENSNLDEKVDNILKLVKAENDLQVLVNSLVDQV
ncbi:Ribonuclease H-like domain,Mediator complex, subunit Med10 [Cinara cedri]|uniref:Mediator of RNA polymerase II transcription subunit 10 n=1 Tax=Cinara cedri TaxID=506608 RepID=A0A5E4MZ14_9HEMI|nr:Ribonuclease H-like domain,Mediator complex, subunit Med10 [Cinara cedri]